MIGAYLTIAGVVILIGIILMFFENGSVSSQGKKELDDFSREQERWKREKHKYSPVTMDTEDYCYKCGLRNWEHH